MISARRIRANRANANVSTGPRTKQGKSRAAKNSYRHGLSLSILADPIHSTGVQNQARQIAGENAGPEILELARRIAEANIDLTRVRQARKDLFNRELNDSDHVIIEPFRVSILGSALRGPDFRQRRKGRRSAMPEVPPNPFAIPKTTKPEHLEKLPLILGRLTQQLLAMDRYERRALSRRKFAIRAFDMACQRDRSSDVRHSNTS